MQVHTGQGLCREPKPLRSSAQVSISDFGRIAKALDAPLQAALQELSGQDPIQLSKGNSWHRYAVLHLQEVFATLFGPQKPMELRPGPNGVMAALINAAVPANVAAPVSPERISEIRARLTIRKKGLGVLFSASGAGVSAGLEALATGGNKRPPG